MANSAAICTSFKVELLTADHNFGVSSATRGSTAADSFKAALILATGSAGAGSTTYASVSASEVSGTNYTAGGVAVTNATVPTSSGTTAIWTPSASFVWTTVTLSTSFDCCFVYNSSRSNKAVAVYTFGAQTVTAGNFTLTMPSNAAGTALLNIA